MRYGFDLIGKTDEEVVVFLKKTGRFSSQQIDDLQEIFMGGIYIKFANESAAQDQIEKDFKRSVLIIKQSIPDKKS